MRTFFKILIANILVFLVFGFCFANKNGKVEWGYHGKGNPTEWAKLSPANTLCLVGRLQSPINIKNAISSRKNLLSIQYQPAPLVIMDDGETRINIGNQTLNANLGKTVQVNFPQVKETMEYNGMTHHLLQFHLHVPSENLIQGKSFPAEIHFVNQGAEGHVAVIAVFIKEGHENPTIQQILKYFPKAAGKTEFIKDISINPANLLPKNRAYYSFQGSLTTPPCSEGLNWIVMKEPIEASAVQLVKLREAVGENARPIQPTNGRKIIFVSG